MNLPLIFRGMYYRGIDPAICKICGEQVRHSWDIHDDTFDVTVHLCERHYRYWEAERERVLLDLAARFRTEVLKKEIEE